MGKKIILFISLISCQIGVIYGRAKDTIVYAKALDFITLIPSEYLDYKVDSISFFELHYCGNKLKKIISRHPEFGTEIRELFYVNDTVFFFRNYYEYDPFLKCYESEICLFYARSGRRRSLFVRSPKLNATKITSGKVYRLKEVTHKSGFKISVNSYKLKNPMSFQSSIGIADTIPTQDSKIEVYLYDPNSPSSYQYQEKIISSGGEETILSNQEINDSATAKYIWINYFR